MVRDDLVRLDETGAIHPVGKTASQWLRARRGTFRLMPAPLHAVFMRYVGDDGQRDDEDGPVVRLAGEIVAPGGLCDVFALIAQAGWKGELVVLDGETSRSVFFESGDVVAGASSAPAERIGELMFRLGVLSREQVDEISAAAHGSGRRFGETAVDLGLTSRERLFEVMRKQIEEIVFGILLVADGMFYFLDRYEERRIAARHHVNANNLLMQAVQRMDEGKYFRERIPSDAHVPAPLPGRSEPPAELASVWSACDGRRSVLEVGRTCGMSEFEVTRALFQLAQSGFLHIAPPAPTGPHALVALFNDAMRAIHRRLVAAGKEQTWREHLAGFATSIGIYDALFAGAGAAEAGSLEGARIEQNLKKLAGGDSTAMLAQWLYEYAAFAVFDAGSMLPADQEAELATEVQPKIALLAP